MRSIFSLKALLRTPVKTLITFLLLAAVSFAFFSRVSEYAVTSRELNRIATGYQGVGMIEREAPPRVDFSYDDALMLDERIPPALIASMGDDYEQFIKQRYTPLTVEEIEALSKLPYISRISSRYMSAGVSEDGFLRANTNYNYYNYTHRFVIEGTYRGGWGGFSHPRFSEAQTRPLRMSDLKVLAGEPEIKANVEHYFPFGLYVLTFPDEILQNPYGFTLKHTNSVSSTVMIPEFDNNFSDMLTRGERYVFTALFNPARWLEPAVPAGDRAMQVQWQSVYSLKGKPDNYIETEEFSALRDLIKLVEDDRHTFDMVYTDDMRAIPRFREDNMRITEGRILTTDDTKNNALVCVVSKRFMNDTKLSVGDFITMRLGDALHTQNAALGAVSVISERRPDNEITVKLEIVGVYDNFDTLRLQTDNPYWNYSNDTIFVPLSLLPETADIQSKQLTPAEISFVVNARDIPKFLDKSAPLIEEMGLTLLFSDSGWLAVENQFTASIKISVIVGISISVAVLITLALIVYLFIGRKTKDYAIMRATGVTKIEAGYALFLPLFCVALLAVIFGGISGFVYSSRTIENSLGVLTDSGYTINTSIPVTALIGCIFAEMAALCGMVLFRLWRLGKKSPLVLLQSGTVQVREKRKKTEETEAVEAPVISFSLPEFSDVPRSFGKLRFTLRHVFLRNRRALLKSTFLLLLAAVFAGVIGQSAVMKYSYEEMYEAVEVKGTFTNGLAFVNAKLVAEKDYTKDPYYEHIMHGNEINTIPATLCMTSDIARLIGVTQTRVEYAPDFDESLLTGEDNFCVLGADLMDALGVSFGDEIQIYRGGYREGLATDRVMNDEQKEVFLRRVSIFFIVAGKIESENPDFKNSAFLPIDTNIEPLLRGVTAFPRYTFAEYTLADNDAADEFREYAKWILGALDGGRSFNLDTSELESLASSVKLWNALFPVVTAALIIAGGLLPGLIIIQSAKEAALFRILGTTKKRTSLILILGQIVLCLLGIMLGLLVILLYNGSAVFSSVASTAVFCAVIYFVANVLTAGFCAYLVTKHKLLDLLQIKE